MDKRRISMDKLKIEYFKTEELTPYAKNPRKNDGAVEPVANSIREFGFKVPIVIDKENNVVCGHTRLKAAKKLGLKTVPCVIADDLNDEQIKGFRLADNKVGELAEWDFDLLGEELDGIFDIDMSEFGFDSDFEEKEEIKKEEGEVPFTEELLLTHNYIVLYFDNDFDWEVAQDKFGLKQVRDLIPRKGQPKGVGRVINGKKVLAWQS